MKKFIFPIIFLLLSASAAFSQDVITKRNGDEITAKVIEITSTEIRYKKIENPDGPIYVVLKPEVFMIKYANGEKEIFEATEVKIKPSSAPRSRVRPQAAPQLMLASDFWGRNIQVDGRRVSKGRVKEAMREVGALEAYSKYGKGRAMAVTGGIMSLASAVPFGLTLSLVIYYGLDENYYVTDDGIILTTFLGGVFVTGIILSTVGSNMVKGSYELCNAKLYNRTTSMTLDYGLTPNGIGLCLRF